MSNSHPLPRRQLLGALAAATGATAQAATGQLALPGDAPTHKIVYQFNHHEPEYQEDVLNSISAVLSKYVDDVHIVVVGWGPGIHLLAKKPKRPVRKLHQQRVHSMYGSYGVEFVACNNTMRSLGWHKEDMLDFVRITPVGAAEIMELHEKGYAYIAW